MVNVIKSERGEDFGEQDLTDNLEALAEHIRDQTNGFGTEIFLAVNKLADHVGLEIQRSRDLEGARKRMEDIEGKADSRMADLSSKVAKANKDIEEAHREAQSSKMEMVAILSIFAAIVIAFSGGLTYLGGTISSSGSAGSTAFSVMVCGLMLFNVLAFLMLMVIVIIRLHRYDDEKMLPNGLRRLLISVIVVIDAVMLAVIGVLLGTGAVALRRALDSLK